MTASTIGNGSPNAHADRPATVAATSEIATLPISEEETARIDSSRIGRQRCSTGGGAKPNSQSVMLGRSISRNSARKVSVTSDRIEPKTPPAIPSSASAASGRPEARSFSVSLTAFWFPDETNVWKASLLVSWSQYCGTCSRNERTSSHSGPTVTTTIRKTITNSEASTAQAARPRFQPRLDERADDRVEAEREHARDEDRQQRPERDQRERDDGEEDGHEQQRPQRDDQLDLRARRTLGLGHVRTVPSRA